MRAAPGRGRGAANCLRRRLLPPWRVPASDGSALAALRLALLAAALCVSAADRVLVSDIWKAGGRSNLRLRGGNDEFVPILPGCGLEESSERPAAGCLHHSLHPEIQVGRSENVRERGCVGER
jgi:hypothetical protein